MKRGGGGILEETDSLWLVALDLAASRQWVDDEATVEQQTLVSTATWRLDSIRLLVDLWGLSLDLTGTGQRSVLLTYTTIVRPKLQ